MPLLKMKRAYVTSSSNPFFGEREFPSAGIAESSGHGVAVFCDEQTQ